MKKYILAVVYGALMAGSAAYWLAGEPLSRAMSAPPTVTATATHPIVASPAAPTATPTPAITPTRPLTTSEPGIPAIADSLYLGVPAGNGKQPYHVAVDDRRRRVYTLNYGSVPLGEGNTISVLDLETSEIVGLVQLDNLQAGDFPQRGPMGWPPDPLDLQVDPYRPRLYALCGNRYAEAPDSALTIVDLDSLKVVNTLAGVEASAVGPDRLYLANDSRLWSADAETLAELEARDLEARQFTQALLLNPQANRLYLARGQPWSLDVFEADSLSPVASYPLTDPIIRAVMDVDRARLLVLEVAGQQVVLRARNADGRPLADPAPVPLTDDVYGDLPLALAGRTLYIAGGDYGDYRLEAWALPNLRRLDDVPLPAQPNDLAADAATGLLYAAYSSPSSYIEAIDPASGSIETIYTARLVRDALADPGLGRLYVLDDAGRLQVLRLADYRPIARLETGFSSLTGVYGGYGQLSLDPGRGRLYVGGDPVRVVDTQALRVTAELDGRGQLTPDPSGDRLYLTPPCNCRVEQCNTLIMDADTLTGTQTLFPPQDAFTAPCVVETQLDARNQLLYAHIYNGVAGSNAGNYLTVFDVAARPKELYTTFDISYGVVAFDPSRRRAFVPRYRMDRSFINRFEARGGTITQTLELASVQGELAYDPRYNRLYAVQKDALLVFDGDLALLGEISLPGSFDLLTLDPQGQRLYLGSPNGDVLVVATGGGQLEPPPPVPRGADQPSLQQLVTAPDGTLFRVYGQRLYRSKDGGRSWELLGRGLPGWLISHLTLSPDYARDHTLLAGLASYGVGGGLFRSIDGGDTWRPTTRGLTDLGVVQVVFSPTYSRDRTIFLTTYYGGLFRSRDGGDTWASLASTYAADAYDRNVNHLALSPRFAEDGLLIISRDRLLRSTDRGAHWQDTGLAGGLVAFSPDFARDRLVLSSGHWRSTDAGRTWQPAAVGRRPGDPEALLFSPGFATDQTVYLALRRDYAAALDVQRSVDGGRSWQALTGGLPPGFEVALLVLLPDGKLSLTAQDGRQTAVQASALSWGDLPLDITQTDLQALEVAPDGAVYVANGDAGVFKSTDAGRTWAETGFPARADNGWQPAHLAMAGDGTLFAAAGTAVLRSRDAGRTWSYLDGVPAGFEVSSLAVSPNFAADGVVVAGGDYHNRQIIRSADAGKTWQVVFDAATLEVEYASDVIALDFSPHFARDKTVYAWLQDGGLLRSADGGLSWSLAAQSGYYGQSLAVSPDGQRLILGALYGHVLVSQDGGQSWLNLGEGIPDERAWSTALAFGDDGALFLGSDQGVYRSPDGGGSWTRASAGLPLNPAEGTPQAVRVLRFHQGRLYAALVQGGLFVSDDQGRSWRSSLSGKPATPIEPAPTPTPGAQSSGSAVTATQTPQPPLTLSECPVPPDYFADLWNERRAQLGCPLASYRLPMVEQSFEGGWMFWRSDARVIYALSPGLPFAGFDDTWDAGQPDYACPELFPSQTPPTPQRGFGKVWCEQPLVREWLGSATGLERPFDAVLQAFDTGLIFQTDQGVTYILENGENGWERVE